MLSDPKKRNSSKRPKIKKLLRPICVWALIQIAIIYMFVDSLPNKKAIDRNELYKFTIMVDDIKYIPGAGTRATSALHIYSDETCYRISRVGIGELSANQLRSRIHIGDTITVLCKEDVPWNSSDFQVFEAYSDTEMFRDLDKQNNTRRSTRIFLIIVFPIFELGFIFLVVGYFYLFFGSTANRKKSKKTQKRSGDGFA